MRFGTIFFVLSVVSASLLFASSPDLTSRKAGLSLRLGDGIGAGAMYNFSDKISARCEWTFRMLHAEKSDSSIDEPLTTTTMTSLENGLLTMGLYSLYPSGHVRLFAGGGITLLALTIKSHQFVFNVSPVACGGMEYVLTKHFGILGELDLIPYYFSLQDEHYRIGINYSGFLGGVFFF